MAARLIIMLTLLEEAKKNDELKKTRQAKQLRNLRHLRSDVDFIHVYRLSEDLINALESDLLPFLPPRLRADGLTNRQKVCLKFHFHYYANNY